jgi:hypothetical protein
MSYFKTNIISYNNNTVFFYNGVYYDAFGNQLSDTDIMALGVLIPDVYDLECVDFCLNEFTFTLSSQTISDLYEIFVENPNDGTNNQVYAEGIDDSRNIALTYDLVINKNGSEIYRQEESNIQTNAYEISFSNLTSTPDMEDGGYVETIRVYRSDTDSLVDLDLSPTGTNLNGVVAVNAANLYYDTGNPNAFVTELKKVMRNAIFNQIGGVETFNFTLDVTNVLPGKFSVRMGVKHNPVALWVGLNINDIYAQVFYDGVSFFEKTNGNRNGASTPVLVEYTVSECTLDLLYNALPSLQLSGINYNTMPTYNSNLFVIDPFGGSLVLNGQCFSYILGIGTTSKQCGSITYVWKDGPITIGTSSTVTVTSSGTYTCSITCDGETATASITV